MVAARLGSLVVAVSPGQAPDGTGAPLSASSAAIRPLPLPMVSSRAVTPAGGTQSVVVDDLSAQYETTQRPSPETVTGGLGCDAFLTASERVATTPTGLVGEVPL